MIIRWLKNRRAERALVVSDATAMIERFGDGAYQEARNWVVAALIQNVVDADRPAGHWARVRAEIRKRNKPPTTADSATRRLEEH